ncbi:MAG TPA: alpha/beta hydrolase-fold protein [Solimonas sp.]|nr:alpha/beta hydrolase-fold protein [Solimonas sp.]
MRLLVLLMAAALAGCGAMGGPAGKASDPIPTALVPAPHPPTELRRMVVVLPGRGDDLERLRASGIAEAIQRAAPDTDVLLAGATFAYYADGGLERRLHEQIMAPARALGYRELWLAGASMGGMGALVYERAHPGELTGLLLMAPFMGEAELVEEIAAGGGPARWDPGPAPAAIDRDNVGREMWRVVRSWAASPELAERVWLVCGADDGFAAGARLIASVLPRTHYLERPGGHAWKVWTPAATEVFAEAVGTMIGHHSP